MTARERDALVAEKVMGWTNLNVSYGDLFGIFRPTRGYMHVPNYSTDISAAWEIVEKMRERGMKIRCCDDGDGYSFWFNGELDASDYSTSAPEAICRAALRGVGVGV